MNHILEDKYNFLNRRIIERFIIIGLFFFQFCPISNITVRFILLFVFIISCLFQNSFHIVNNIRCLILILILTFFLISYHGLAVAKDFFIFCFGILSIYHFSKRYTFSGNIIYEYFIYVIIPLGILNLVLYHNVHYLPFTTGQVNIIGKDVTKHGTAIIGTVLFVGAGYNLLKSGCKILKKDIIFFFISFYLLFFSGSRSCLLALVATMFLYLLNKNKYKKVITSFYFIIMIISVYFMEYIQDYTYLIKNEYVLDLIRADGFKNHGVTSGREWLWNYHWDSFINSPYLLGGGRKVVDFRVGDYIPLLRIKAHAGSESPYTAMIACNGIIGFIQLGILIYLSFKAIIKENLLGTCIIFISIYNTTMGVNLTNVLHANSLLLYLLYFSSFTFDGKCKSK